MYQQAQPKLESWIRWTLGEVTMETYPRTTGKRKDTRIQLGMHEAIAFHMWLPPTTDVGNESSDIAASRLRNLRMDKKKN
jgi:hypothetical protein